MSVVALLIGIVAAGLVDLATTTARRRGSGSLFILAAVMGAALAFGGLILVREVVGETADVYYFVGFIPTLLAGDFLSKRVDRALDRANKKPR